MAAHPLSAVNALLFVSSLSPGVSTITRRPRDQHLSPDGVFLGITAGVPDSTATPTPTKAPTATLTLALTPTVQAMDRLLAAPLVSRNG